MVISTTLNAKTKHRLAILDFKSIGAVDPSEAKVITNMVLAVLSNSKLLDIVERENIDVILSELAFHESGINCSESSCAIKIGRLLSVNKIIIGEVLKVEQKFTINAKFVDVETGKIDFSVFSEADSITKLNKALYVLSKKIIEKITDMTIDEEGNPVSKNRWPYIWRSMIFPGYGHYYANNYSRGLFYSGTFVVAVGFYVAADNAASTNTLSNAKQSRRVASAAAVGLIYLINILDASLFAEEKTADLLSFNIYSDSYSSFYNPNKNVSTNIYFDFTVRF